MPNNITAKTKQVRPDQQSPVSEPGPRRRLLDVADRLFSEEGVHVVGIDRRMITESALHGPAGRIVLNAIPGIDGDFAVIALDGNSDPMLLLRCQQQLFDPRPEAQ